MKLMHAGLLLLFFHSAFSYQSRRNAGSGLYVQDPELEWERMETVIGEDLARAPAPETKYMRSSSSGGSSTPEAKKVVEYKIVSASEDMKEVFKPEKNAQPLPQAAKEMLLGGFDTTSATGKAAARTKMVEVLCHVDRMYVRIVREVFKMRDSYKYLKLGSCPVNQGTKQHYYLLYLLKTDCGFKKQSNVDDISISNVLHYQPTGPVLREMSFDIPVQCKFPRFFHSFKVGFYPKLQGGTVFKALQPKSSFTLTPLDASGNEITGGKTYTLGQPMYFEAKKPDRTASLSDKRMYINKCFITASQDPNSNPKYTVIDNQGCLVDGKVTGQSKFLTGPSKMAQKFSVGSLIFKGTATTLSSQQLYMHCDVYMGKLTPTPSSKACNYDATTKKWKELYGDDSVCTCCESTCSSAKPRAASRNMISSHSWKVNLSSKDDYAEVNPRMKSFDADSINYEDPDMVEHADFLNYWEHDY